ncbi:hypothetical protein EXIGLDRAFT_830417 [Exidia glandulosa HHB12029]|uniref:Uncharacterized protein n=1 Tax=Exidia glandulosa HHB12029 TaxID=1314781 RepID=A0A165NNT2_EXIGL|nr:hypothetical protein EXIGLDRAFT_830417 [Exidia glandulosa HHB12029]
MSDVASDTPSPASLSPSPYSLDQVVAIHTSKIAKFLQSEIPLAIWAPETKFAGSTAWDIKSINRIIELGIPRMPDKGIPDMVLHALGRTDTLDATFSARLDDVLGGDEHIFIANAAGTGKTRLLAEVLLRVWGLYFTFSLGTVLNTYGSSDLVREVSSIGTQELFGSGLYTFLPASSRMSRAALRKLAHNRVLARRLFQRLLLARLLVFNDFCVLCQQHNIPDRDARYRWLLLQFRPEEVVRADPLRDILVALQDESDEEVSGRIATLCQGTCAKLRFIAVDDMQVGMSRARFAFASKDHLRNAPLVRELLLVVCDSLPQSRLLLSGRRLDLDMVEEALSASQAVVKNVRHVYDLGSVDSEAHCTAYLQHFFARAITAADCHNVYSWTRGRHGYLALLTSYLLVFGVRHLRRVLDSMIVRLTGHERPASSLQANWFFHNVKLVMDDKDLEGSSATLDLRRATLDYALHGRQSTFTTHSRDLVGISAATFSSSSEACISEPIVMARLTQWLTTSTTASLHGVITRKLEDNTLVVDDAAFICGLAPALWDALSGGMTLQDLFDFPGHKPIWASHAAAFALPQLTQRRNHFKLLDARPPEGLIRSATSPQDVLDWLHTGSHPFIIPDVDFGADLLFVMQIHSQGYILVCVHTKFMEPVRGRRDLRAVPRDPGTFYNNVPEAQERFLSALNKFPQLQLGSRKRARGAEDPLARYARFPTLSLLCFKEPWRANESYDPPVASVNFTRLLQLRRPVEVDIAAVASRIMGSE